MTLHDRLRLSHFLSHAALVPGRNLNWPSCVISRFQAGSRGKPGLERPRSVPCTNGPQACPQFDWKTHVTSEAITPGREAFREAGYRSSGLSVEACRLRRNRWFCLSLLGRLVGSTHQFGRPLAAPRRHARLPSTIGQASGRGPGLRKPLLRSCPCFRGLYSTIARLTFRLQGEEQPACHLRYIIDRLVEGSLVRLRWGVESAQFAHELQRRCPYFLLRRGWSKIEQRPDIPAHRNLPGSNFDVAR